MSASTGSIRIHNAEEIRATLAAWLLELRGLIPNLIQTLEQERSDTRERKIHPLLNLVDEMEAWIRRPEFENADYERSAIETLALVTILRARQADPALPEVVSSMVDPNQFRHAQAILGIAYQVGRDGDRRVELVRKQTNEDGKVPDLWVFSGPGLVPSFQVEAKAPPLLRTKGGRLRLKVAARAVSNAMSAGRLRPEGQFFPDIPGVVALVSYEVPIGDFALLKEAADMEFRSRKNLSPVLSAMLFVNFRRVDRKVQREVGATSEGVQEFRVSLTWTSDHELSTSPAYKGVPPLEVAGGRRQATDVLDFTDASSA